MRRALAVLLVAAMIGTVGVWFASHFIKLRFYREVDEASSFRSFTCSCDKGGFSLFFVRAPDDRPKIVDFFWMTEGFALYSCDKRGSHMSGIHFPLWSLALVLFLLNYAVVLRGPLRRRRRRRRGQCIHCGYDLTGLPGPRCPECGRNPVLSEKRAQPALDH